MLLSYEVVVPLAPLRPEAAERLYARRAAQSSGRAVQDGEQPVVSAIAARLDGLPLALELAAARTRELSHAGILERLDQRFELLGVVPPDPARSPSHHATLSAAIGSSWELLGPDAGRRGPARPAPGAV